MSKLIREDGVLAFTVESLDVDYPDHPRGYRLVNSGRFAYAKRYIDELIATHLPASSFQVLM